MRRTHAVMAATVMVSMSEVRYRTYKDILLSVSPSRFIEVPLNPNPQFQGCGSVWNTFHACIPYDIFLADKNLYAGLCVRTVCRNNWAQGYTCFAVDLR